MTKGDVRAENVIFTENFDNYAINSTPSSWYQQRNYQWGDMAKPCMNGNTPASWNIVTDPIDASNKMVEIKLSGPPCQLEISPINLVIPNLSNYKYSFDMMFEGGTNKDRNVVFRFLKGDQWYGLKMTNSTQIELIKVNIAGYSHLGTTTYDKSFNAHTKYNFAIETINNVISLYINKELIYQVTDQEPILDSGTIALQASIGSLGDTDTFFDNIVVTDLSKPKIHLLNIPFFSQIDPQWGSKTYDSATKWASTNHQGIKDWGCALTSATMVLNYQGFTKTPDGLKSTAPDTLNEYLIGTKKGYSSYGHIIWPEIANYANSALTNGYASPSAFPLAFEYPSYSKTDVLNDLIATKSGILRIITNAHSADTADDDDTHFVVASGWDDENNIYIADPLQSTYNATQSGIAYPGKELSKYGRFVASKDPSYFWFYNHDLSSTLKVEKNGQIGSSFVDTVGSGDGETSSHPSWAYVLPKPEAGTYSISATSTESKIIPLEMYVFDRTGKSIVLTPKFVTISQGRTATLQYNKENVNNTVFTINSTFSTLKQTVTYVFSKYKHLKKFIPITNQVVGVIEKTFQKNQWVSYTMLKTFNDQIEQYQRHQIISSNDADLIFDEIDRVMNKYSIRPPWHHVVPHKPCDHR
jgi:hypothetical protein